MSKEDEEKLKKKFEQLPNWMNPYKLEKMQEEFYGMKKKKVKIPTDTSIVFENQLKAAEKARIALEEAEAEEKAKAEA